MQPIELTTEQKILDTLEQIRPFLHEDGGDIELIEVTDNQTVKVRFKGACTTCNMSNMTFKAGVEDAILKSVSEIKKVILVFEEKSL